MFSSTSIQPLRVQSYLFKCILNQHILHTFYHCLPGVGAVPQQPGSRSNVNTGKTRDEWLALALRNIWLTTVSYEHLTLIT